MDRFKTIFRGKGAEAQRAADITSKVKGASKEEKVSMLKLIYSARNQTEFFKHSNDEKLNSFKGELQAVLADKTLDADSVYEIAFDTIRASLPSYLAEELHSSAQLGLKDEVGKKINQFEENSKIAQRDGIEAAGNFPGLSYSVKLRLLGFALCGAYLDEIKEEAKQFEQHKSDFAKIRRNEKLYVKGCALGIEYKEGFISAFLKTFPPEYQEEFDAIPANLGYEERKRRILEVINALIAKPPVIASKNKTPEDKNGVSASSDNGTTTAAITATTTTANTATTTTTTTSTTTTTTTTATTTAAPTPASEMGKITGNHEKEKEEEKKFIDLGVVNTFLAEATDYLKTEKEQNCYSLKVAPEIQSNDEIYKNMQEYRRAFDAKRSITQKKLYRMFDGRKDPFMENVRLLSSMSSDGTKKVAFIRELSTVNGVRDHSEAVNSTVLGNNEAEMRTSTEARRSGNQLSFLMRAPMWNGTGDKTEPSEESVVSPLVLSVCAPALDFDDEPEWKEYVDENGELKKEKYGEALKTISNQILACARDNSGHEVVLSAFGMNNFIGGLSRVERSKAFAMGIANMRELVKKLRDEKIKVRYTDGERGSEFWQLVQNGLSEEIQYAGRITGEWVTDEVMIINAWDPCSVIGNGCVRDNSIDGYIGRNSLVHEAHAMLIHASRLGLLTEETGAVKG